MKRQLAALTGWLLALLSCFLLDSPARGQTLPPDVQAAITTLGVKLTVLSRPAFPKPIGKWVQVTLTPQVSNLTNTVVNFGLPFPPDTLTDHRMIRVLDANGVEVPTYTQPLVYWWVDRRQGAIRSVQIQFQASFTGLTAKTYTIWWDKARTQNRPTLTSVDQTYDVVTTKPTGGTSTFSFHRPRVLATFPQGWLTDSLLVWQQVPQDRATAAPWLDPYELAQFPGSLQYIAVNDPKNFEMHLFDRGATYCKIYVRSGQVAHLLASIEATDFYIQHINASGFFDVKPPPEDYKYIYTEGPVLMYMLTGDPRYSAAALRGVTAWQGWNPYIVYVPGIGQVGTPGQFFWTERHHGFGMMANIHAYELTGTTAYLDVAKQYLDAALDMQVHPKDGGPTNGCWIHYWSDHDGGGDGQGWTSSPWMSAFLTDAIWKYFMLTNDPRCAASLALYEKYAQRYAVTPGGHSMWYMANDGTPARGVSTNDYGDTDIPTDAPHNMEGTYHMALGHYLSSGTDTQFRSYVTTLSAEAVTEDANSPGRRFNWEFRESPMLIWFLQNTGATQPPVPPPPAPKPNPTPTPPVSPSGKFTIVTSASGVQAIENGFVSGDWVSGLSLVDLDGDNKLDLYVSMHDAASQPRAVAALNNGSGVFTKSVSNNYPKSEMHVPYDLNEDGKLDLAVTYNDGGSIWYTSQSSPGNLAFTQSNVSRDTNTARINVLLDINKDGKVDWLRGAAPGLVIDTGVSPGNFNVGAKTINTNSVDNEDTAAFPIDLNNSGVYSLAMSWGGSAIANGLIRVYRNDGAMNFTDVTTAIGLPTDGCIKGVGDYNQDGYSDLLVLENNHSTWNIYLNDGAGHFSKKSNAISGMTGTPILASGGMGILTDFDNDGIGDLLVGWYEGLAILRGTGGGNFTYMNTNWVLTNQSKGDDGWCFGDIDGDGMLDVVAYNGNLSTNPTHFDVYHNDLTKKNWINVRVVGLPGNKGAAGAKIRINVPGGPLLWYEPVQIMGKQMASSYYSFLQTERHFGLGSRTKVDVSVQFYPSGKTMVKQGVNVNSTIIVQETP